MSGDGVSAATRQCAEDACATMQAALGALRDSRDASCPAPTRDQVAGAVQLVRTEVAKLGLVYHQAGEGASSAPNGIASSAPMSGAGAAPSDAEAEALLRGLQCAVSTLCMLYTGIAAAAGAGPTLRASLDQTATAVVEACVALVR